MDGAAGVTAMAVRVAAVTDTVIFVVTEFSVAEITALPGPAAVTTPPALTVATVGLTDIHVTELVTSFADPSEYVPFAVNCCVCPDCRNGGDPGERAMVCSTGAPMVRLVAPEIELDVALIAVVASPTPTAREVEAGMGNVPGAGARVPSQTIRTI
jgi:hypothetical protein